MKNIKDSIEHELKEGILGYWIDNCLDKEFGGFYGVLSNVDVAQKGAEKGLIQNARNLWSFSRSYNHFKDTKYLEIAARAKDYLLKYFLDRENGGFFWTVTEDGKPLNRRKQVYGQAFAIYALSEYYIASGDEDSLTLAKKVFHLLEKYAYDRENSGYLEAFSDKWELIEDIRLSPMDLNEKKSNNTHLHIMEAYTTLYKVWNDYSVKNQLKRVVKDMLFKVMDIKTLNFTLFFDEKWNKKSGVISYGHEIEASWLIYEALKAVGDEEFLQENIKYVIGIAENCLDKYLDGELGSMGMFNEEDAEGFVDRDKVWWVQAEACVGFYLAYQLTGKKYFLTAVENIWSFIRKYVVDSESGEWLWYATDTGTKSKMFNKISNWKSLYHNSRACIELLERMGDC